MQAFPLNTVSQLLSNLYRALVTGGGADQLSSLQKWQVEKRRLETLHLSTESIRDRFTSVVTSTSASLHLLNHFAIALRMGKKPSEVWMVWLQSKGP